MSENHQGASMEALRGFEREAREKERKKMINHWDSGSIIAIRIIHLFFFSFGQLF